MNEVIRFLGNNAELIEIAFQIRTNVFVEEQAVAKEIEYDGFDDEAVHFLLFRNQIPAGTCRIRETKEGFKLERLAVLKEFRGKGIGAELMEHMMNEVLPSDKKIYLNSQADVIDVYKKFGFRIVGSMFFEAGIEHYKMVYTP